MLLFSSSSISPSSEPRFGAQLAKYESLFAA